MLLIEEDRQVRQLVQRGLGERGFTVMTASDRDSAVRALSSGAAEVVLLDLVAPDVQRFALLAAIRAMQPRLPVIAFIASDDDPSRARGIGYGADDYVTKPLSLAELAVRMRARLRPREWAGTPVVVGPLVLDLASHRASIGDKSASLSARESSLLATFMRHAGDVLPRDELLRLVWEIEFDPRSNVVDVYVSALRRKLGADVIETVRGRGYRLPITQEQYPSGFSRSPSGR